ncbi:hypothetical protein GCK72_012120 [Caenorhabditis remanei]|uniref:BTB domain-containing protein n=1 Tax=Caenorhabditis remanei TaxID=31234 RepID=A0A6A5GK58_CAERE|nr:hypothetical protein GCK72_012120 [Caenorhabditis remanei]KAF1755670.1 hypothetical protein GCK72_012120 [Caenorhabditis remanei]
MGAKQSQERKSYLEDYPDPLGHFTSIYNIENISSIVANRHQNSLTTAKWFVKMNIHFTHGIRMPEGMEDSLFLVIYCGVLCTNSKYWRIKANVKFVLHDLNDVQNSVEYHYGDVWFDNYNHEMPVIYQDTNISLDSLLNENLGFVKNNEMKMSTDIRVLKVEGFHQPTVVNYRVPPTDPFYQLIFAYPNENLYVNKEMLNAHCILESHHTQVRDLDEIKFNRPSPGEIEEFLDCIYGFPIPSISRGTLPFFLRNAKSLRLRSLAQRAAQTIVNDKAVDVFTKAEVIIAVDFDMRRVVHAWLNKKKSISKNDLEDFNIEKMSGETIKAIVKRVLKFGGWEKEEE